MERFNERRRRRRRTWHRLFERKGDGAGRLVTAVLVRTRKPRRSDVWYLSTKVRGGNVPTCTTLVVLALAENKLEKDESHKSDQLINQRKMANGSPVSVTYFGRTYWVISPSSVSATWFEAPCDGERLSETPRRADEIHQPDELTMRLRYYNTDRQPKGWRVTTTTYATEYCIKLNTKLNSIPKLKKNWKER